MFAKKVTNKFGGVFSVEERQTLDRVVLEVGSYKKSLYINKVTDISENKTIDRAKEDLAMTFLDRDGGLHLY